ncbi:hypothetical protein MTR67_026638 [Solanum verrucosum]|uniref:Uncharacterized protein n=1 Tax=Solanum verrucosum TaxID=315347 RepID=A0AAF0R250_SOLVR|nr:hypothetical protein MTR67_026638 [Solanum verrucosum]
MVLECRLCSQCRLRL